MLFSSFNSLLNLLIRYIIIIKWLLLSQRTNDVVWCLPFMQPVQVYAQTPSMVLQSPIRNYPTVTKINLWADLGMTQIAK